MISTISSVDKSEKSYSTSSPTVLANTLVLAKEINANKEMKTSVNLKIFFNNFI